MGVPLKSKLLYIYIGLFTFLVGCKSFSLKKEKIFIIPTDIVTNPQRTLPDLPCDSPFKNLAYFNNDTLSYFRYNLEERSGCYSGKSLKLLLSEISLPVKSYMPDALWRPRYVLEGVYLDFFKTDSLRSLYAEKAIKSRIRLVYIEFTNTVSKDTSKVILKRGPWNTYSIEYYQDKIIRSIKFIFI